MARKPYCSSEEVFVSSVTIYETAPILILLLIGIAISLIVFGFEKFVFFVMHSKRTANPLKVRKRNKVLLLTNKDSSLKNNVKRLPKANILFQKGNDNKAITFGYKQHIIK